MLAPISNDQIKVIKNALGEDDARFAHNLKLLEDWMQCHPFIPKNYDPDMLPIFLRSCKHSMEASKRKLENYFVYKKRYPESFSYCHFNEAERKTMDVMYVSFSRNLTPEGYTVSHLGFRTTDITGCDLNAFTRFLLMFATYKAHNVSLCAGDVIVMHLNIFSPALLAGIITPLFWRSINMLQDVYPARLRGIYVTYLPGYAVAVANLTKMIFKEKIRNRISMETNNEHMLKSLPANCIPKEYGGTDVSMVDSFKYWLQRLADAEPWFNDHDKAQAVGEIPQEVYAASGINDECGTQGSFRQLEID